MTPRHHVADDLLLELAAGRLRAGLALVVGVHLDGCTQCRQRLHLLEAVAGTLMEECEPLALAPDAWSRTLERIDGQGERPRRDRARRVGSAAALKRLPGLAWPERLNACTSSRWIWMGPGMRFARLNLPEDPQARLFLLRIGAGRSLPRHSHHGVELTQVLCGTFDDGRDTFGPGDFDATDDHVLHQPVVRAGGECVCLAYVENGLRFEGRIAALVGRWVGM